jgi:7-cyano-7-deazaguanine synthase
VNCNPANHESSPSVVLLSGGLDSAANLALCCLRDRAVLTLTVDYGQRAARREIAAARSLAEYYGVRHEVLDLRWLGALGGSALTEEALAVPRLATSELDTMPVITESARAVWVPNRNGVLINAAAAHAERLGARRVVVGFNREEAATFPDNSSAYVLAASRALGYSTANGVEVHCYTAELDKTEIVAELRKLPRAFPFDQLWSCYHGGATACGQCESCRRFNRATRGAL